MRVMVLSEKELVESLGANKPLTSHCISIRNPDEKMPDEIRKGFASILELKFYDANHVDHLGPQQKIKRVPELRDIKGVIEYVNRTKERATGYTIHCWEGVSRSPAIALGVLYMLYGSEAAAETKLRQIRPITRPLSRIVELFDKALGCHLSESSDRIRKDRLIAMKREIEGEDVTEKFLERLSNELKD